MKKLLLSIFTLTAIVCSLQILNAQVTNTRYLDFADESEIDQFSNHAASYTITRPLFDTVMRVEVNSAGQYDAMYWWVNTTNIAEKPFFAFSAKSSASTFITVTLVGDNDATLAKSVTFDSQIIFSTERMEYTAMELATLGTTNIRQISINLGSTIDMDFEWIALGVHASAENHVSTLSSLSVDGYSLIPSTFDPTKTTYLCTVAAGLGAPTVNYTVTDSTSTAVYTAPIDMNSESPSDKVATVTVTAEDGVLETAYNIYYTTTVIGIDDDNNNKLRIYPVPAGNTLNIANAVDVSSCNIISITGSILHSQKITNQNEALNISHLNSGMYFIQLMNDEKVIHTQKFIKK